MKFKNLDLHDLGLFIETLSHEFMYPDTWIRKPPNNNLFLHEFIISEKITAGVN